MVVHVLTKSMAIRVCVLKDGVEQTVKKVSPPANNYDLFGAFSLYGLSQL